VLPREKGLVEVLFFGVSTIGVVGSVDVGAEGKLMVPLPVSVAPDLRITVPPLEVPPLVDVPPLVEVPPLVVVPPPIGKGDATGPLFANLSAVEVEPALIGVLAPLLAVVAPLGAVPLVVVTIVVDSLGTINALGINPPMKPPPPPPPPPPCSSPP
jgi:hypothetical protein